ncbi:hypothetical protein COJ85_01870 [Bacillus sp. AFS076308]|uniref:DUF3291 domain-containing protein n=1 Tax=unclassified Bacillus (in: firmicutes) TaxID=185979 RepID=UPI000BF41EC7|nr:MULTISPECIES: DUF3291 domain-containing protein [unclassified Bacillus (in: firmicutes)]PFO09378.1 hypothetical protein COJ85_01870 [Bacillus sp. AFS076308]PGV50356.1 hypothetical protein COD92_18455 [Bacillus sp. AFS037270]
MAFVAIYTVGRLKHPYEHPASREFFEVGYDVIRQAVKSGNLIKEFSPNGVPFPEEAIPGDGDPILTLTVWKNLQSLYRFTYSGQHKQALRDRNKWIGPHQEKQPTYVLWWAEKVKEVSWEEAFKRYNYYIQNGPTPFAFDYKHAFDEVGETFVVK